MKKSWRMLIACLLLVMLPLQGFAVSSGFSCAMGMAGQLSALNTSVSSNSHCQGLEVKVGKLVSDSTLGQAAKLSKAHDVCKSSSPCCMGVALLPAAHITIFVPVHQDAPVLPVLLPASVSVSTLERPPKHTLI